MSYTYGSYIQINRSHFFSESDTAVVTKRRKSQANWHNNRGRIRLNIPCEGSGKFPTAITFDGDWHVDKETSKPKGELPRGTCPTCNDEVSLNVLDKSGAPTIRKHKNPTAPYRRQILITEEAYRMLDTRFTKTGAGIDKLDDLADLILKDYLYEE